MKHFEIYWSDLTKEAQGRLSELNHENIEVSPLATIDIENVEYEIDVSITEEEVKDFFKKIHFEMHYLCSKPIPNWNHYDHDHYRMLLQRAGLQ